MTANLLSPEIAALDLEFFMREALKEADAAGSAGEYPIGAVLTVEGKIISRGRARHNELRSQLAHAEMNALHLGGDTLWENFERAVLFTTLEPCPMCFGCGGDGRCSPYRFCCPR